MKTTGKMPAGLALGLALSVGVVATSDAVADSSDAIRKIADEDTVSRVFAASEMHRVRVAKRLEIARRLERPEFADLAMRAEDLEGFRRYAEEEIAQWKDYPGNPEVNATVLNVADFGAVGDGVTTNDAAFVRAVAAVRSQGGRPTVLKIPAGTYWFAGRTGGAAHVDFSSLTNCLVTGEGPERTRFLFGEPDSIGVCFDACCNSTLASVEMYWKTCPFSQGFVEKVDKSTDPRSLVIRHVADTKRPDDPHFRQVKRAKVCGTFDADGHQVLGAPLFFDVLDPVPAEDLGAGRFRIKLDRRHVYSYDQMNVKEGMTVVLPDRVNNMTAVRAHRSRFCNFDSVWIRNSPEAAFTTGGEYITAWKCRVFPLKPHHRLSTNADAFFNAPGTFLGRCEFRNMNDDGGNSHYHGVALAAADARARTLRFAQHGISSFRRGEPLQVYRAKTGELVATLHVESSVIGTDKSGRFCEVTVREPLPEGLVTMASLKLGDLTAEQRYALSHGVGEKPKEFADVVYAPHGRGLGYVVTGCTFADFRGIAVNTQCPNTLIENNTIEHCNHGVQVSSLMMWYEGLPCYNLVVRGNVFRHTLRGINGYLSTVDGGTCRTDYIRGALVEGNSYDAVTYPVRFRNCRDIVVKDAVKADVVEPASIPVGMDFRLILRQEPASAPAEVKSGDASSVSEKTDGNVRTVISAFATGPVRHVIATCRAVDAAESRYGLVVETAEGWYLEKTDYPQLPFPATLGASADDDRIVIGGTKGGIITSPARFKSGWSSTCRAPRTLVAQFCAFWDDERGWYVATEDPFNAWKELGFRRTEQGLSLICARMAFETGRVTLPYDVVVRTVKRTDEPLVWQDFADLHRPFLARCPWSRTPFGRRTDVPAWLKDAPAFVRFSRQWLEHPEWIDAFTAWWRRTYGEGDVVAALWGWEKEGTWWGPDYFPCHPSDEVFKRNMALLRARGFHPFAWPSGYNWAKMIGRRADGTFDIDYRETFIRDAASMLVRRRDGTPLHQDAFWMRDGALTTLCGGVPAARDWFCGVARGLGERGCDMVQVDQQVSGDLAPCYADDHGHPRGAGPWQTDAFTALLAQLRREFTQVQPAGVIAFEEPNPLYHDLIGIQDYRDLESSADEYASVFNYLFHGYMPTFQSNPFRGDLYTLAWQAADGQMPFHRMMTDDFKPSRPLLANGGFEEGVDSVRGPIGWDRIMANRFYRDVDVEKPLWNFTGANNMGWLGIGYRLQETDRHGGERALLIDPSLSTNASYRLTTVQVAQTVEGLQPGAYRLSAWAKTEKGAEQATIRFGSRAGEQGAIAFPVAGKGWTQIAGDVTVGADGVLRVIVFVRPGARVYVDDVALCDAQGNEVRTSKQDWYVDYLKKWISLYRGAGRPFLAEGFQEKPPRLQCARVTRLSRTVPAVCHAAYRSLDGRRALVLANATDKPQPVSYRWNGQVVSRVLPPAALELVMGLK